MSRYLYLVLAVLLGIIWYRQSCPEEGFADLAGFEGQFRPQAPVSFSGRALPHVDDNEAPAIQPWETPLPNPNLENYQSPGPLYSQVQQQLEEQQTGHYDPLHQYYLNPVIDVSLPTPTSMFDIPQTPPPEGQSDDLTKTHQNSFAQLINDPILPDSGLTYALHTGHRFPGATSEYCTKQHLEQGHSQFTCQTPDKLNGRIHPTA